MIAAFVKPEKTMSSIVKTTLIFIAVWFAAAPALAQQPGRGKPAEAQKNAAAQDPLKQAAALFEAGQNAHQRGDLEQALAHYHDALKLDPALWQAEFQAGTAYAALKRFAEARQAITHVIEQLKEFGDTPESRPLVARAQVVLGECALAETKFAEAEQAFRSALVLHPAAARARASLAEVLLATGKRAEAINEAKAALAAGDERVATRALLAEALLLEQRYDEALYEKPRWLPDLKAWSRGDRLRHMAEGTDIASSVSSATRPPGKYSVKWDGKDQAGKPVKAGKYTLYLEAAREHGTYQLMQQEIDLAGASAQYKLAANTEVAGATVEFKKP